jgi:hypothetical protein
MLLRSHRYMALCSKGSKSVARRLVMGDGLKLVLGAVVVALVVLLLVGGFSGGGMGYGIWAA